MNYLWATRLLVAMIALGAGFGVPAHAAMAADANAMQTSMPCCHPVVTAQDAAPSNAVAIVSVLPVVTPSGTWRAIISRPTAIARPTLHLPKIPKQLSLVGSIFKRE